MKVVIVGAGATGLALSYILARSGVEVEIIEGSHRAGGLLSTFDVGDDHRLEYFYHHFFTHDAEINWLLGELNLENDILFKSSTMGIYRNGQVHNFNGIRDLLSFKAMSFLSRFRFGISSALLAYRKYYTTQESQTALAWFLKNAGKDATDAIWRPMLEVKFGDQADRIPLAWIAGRLRQRVLSRKAGVEKLGYLRGSLQRLTDTLVMELADLGVKINLGKKVAAVDPNGSPAIELEDGSRISGNQLVFTIPSDKLASLMSPILPSYATDLAKIEYLGALCTVLSFKEPLSSIYWTNVADGQFDFGGVIEQTQLVPASEYGGQHLVYLSKYAALNDSIWQDTDKVLIDRQLSQLETMYQRPVREDLNRSWVFRTQNAAPLTDLGFRDRIPPFAMPIDNLWMASMCHLYPEERSVNNSIRIAAEIADEMGFIEAASMVPRGISEAGKAGKSPPLTIRRAA